MMWNEDNLELEKEEKKSKMKFHLWHRHNPYSLK